MIEPIDWKHRATYLAERHGASFTARSVLTVILVRKEGGFGGCGANGWRSNSTERRMYEEGE
jgi:hypothetical protein